MRFTILCVFIPRPLARAISTLNGEMEKGKEKPTRFHRSSRTRLWDYGGNLEIYLCMCRRFHDITIFICIYSCPCPCPIPAHAIHQSSPKIHPLASSPSRYTLRCYVLMRPEYICTLYVGRSTH